jgi:hypothetical protein
MEGGSVQFAEHITENGGGVAEHFLLEHRSGVVPSLGVDEYPDRVGAAEVDEPYGGETRPRSADGDPHVGVAGSVGRCAHLTRGKSLSEQDDVEAGDAPAVRAGGHGFVELVVEPGAVARVACFPEQRVWNTLPWSSVTFVDPARVCSPSMF